MSLRGLRPMMFGWRSVMMKEDGGGIMTIRELSTRECADLIADKPRQ